MTDYQPTAGRATTRRELDDLVVNYGKGKSPSPRRSLRPMSPEAFGFAKQAVKPLTAYASLLGAADPMHYVDYAAVPLGLLRRWGDRVQANIDARERAGQKAALGASAAAALPQVLAGAVSAPIGWAEIPLLADKGEPLGWALHQGANGVGDLERRLMQAVRKRLGSEAERVGLRGRQR